MLTYGSDSSGTVKVFLNGQEKGSASANTVSQKAELVFNTGGQGFADLGDGRLEFNALPAISAGDILQVQEAGSIILIQSIVAWLHSGFACHYRDHS